MSSPIGRFWIKQGLISGYIKIGMNSVVKFGAPVKQELREEVILVYPPKEKDGNCENRGAE